MANKKYNSIFERLVASTVLSVPDDPTSCWLWTGHLQHNGYPRICLRNDEGQPRNVQAHRLMLEIFHDVYFPFDEAGHLCNQPGCINPMHLEIQTLTHNKHDRRGIYAGKGEGCWIPVIFLRDDLDERIEAAWNNHEATDAPCPF